MSALTSVEFRTGIRDKLAYAQRWLRMAFERGARVRVLGSEADLRSLSQQLWVVDKESFLAHAWAGTAAAATPGLARTTIWLGAGAVAGPAPELLLNLERALPASWQDCQRIIEVVGVDEAEVQAGRERWAAYRRQGLEPAHRKAEEETGHKS